METLRTVGRVCISYLTSIFITWVLKSYDLINCRRTGTEKARGSWGKDKALDGKACFAFSFSGLSVSIPCTIFLRKIDSRMRSLDLFFLYLTVCKLNIYLSNLLKKMIINIRFILNSRKHHCITIFS